MMTNSHSLSRGLKIQLYKYRGDSFSNMCLHHNEVEAPPFGSLGSSSHLLEINVVINCVMNDVKTNWSPNWTSLWLDIRLWSCSWNPSALAELAYKGSGDNKGYAGSKTFSKWTAYMYKTKMQKATQNGREPMRDDYFSNNLVHLERPGNKWAKYFAQIKIWLSLLASSIVHLMEKVSR